MRGNVLVIDDELKYFKAIKKHLKAHNVYYAENLPSVKDKFKRYQIDVAIVDLNLKRKGKDNFSGTDYIETIRRRNPEVKIAVLSGYNDVPRIVKAVKNGADEYLYKGEWNLASRDFRELMNDLVGEKRKQDDLRQKLRRQFWGVSAFSQNVKEKIKLLAQSRDSFFLVGEAGVGKESLLKTLQYESLFYTDKRELLKLDLSLVQEEEVLNQMSFRVKSKANNIFRASHNHLLWVDKIERASMALQDGFFEMIEQKTYIKSQEALRIQFVFTTEYLLPELLEQGKLNPDLYHSLDLLPIKPLRERIGDILTIAHNWLGQRKEPYELGKDTAQALIQYSFPGNVSELFKVLQLAVADHAARHGENAQTIPIGAVSLPPQLREVEQEPIQFKVARLELTEINKCLALHYGKPEYKSKVAHELGITSADNLKKTYINKYNRLYPELIQQYPLIVKAYAVNGKKR